MFKASEGLSAKAHYQSWVGLDPALVLALALVKAQVGLGKGPGGGGTSSAHPVPPAILFFAQALIAVPFALAFFP